MDPRLAAFVEHAREKGMDLEALRQLLASAGWKEQDISAAIAAHELDLSVPTPTGTSSARETFLHLVAFTALYTWVIALIALVFQYVNLAFPDPAASNLHWERDRAYSGIRQSIAAIIVAFPIFFFVWRALLREIARQPEKARSRVRRALTYLSLFIASVTIVSDVITLVYYLLEGELTTRFLLKVAALFVIAGAVFVYLVLALREQGEEEAT